MAEVRKRTAIGKNFLKKAANSTTKQAPKGRLERRVLRRRRGKRRERKVRGITRSLAFKGACPRGQGLRKLQLKKV